jgi:hypothetical protein
MGGGVRSNRTDEQRARMGAKPMRILDPATSNGRQLLLEVHGDGDGNFGKFAKNQDRIRIRCIEAEAVASTLDACREHMGCACPGIDGHLAERGLLFR